MSRDIEKADGALAEAYKKLKEAYEINHPGFNMFITHVDRTQPEQLRLFCQGRLDRNAIVTWCDGYNKISRHNYTPSQAIDFGIMQHGVITWEDKYVREIGNLLFQLGYSGEIEWGGEWKIKDKYDPYHIQTRHTTK